MLPFELTKDTPYLALSGELWSVFYEYFNRNWPCYKGFLLYLPGDLCIYLRQSRYVFDRLTPHGLVRAKSIIYDEHDEFFMLMNIILERQK